MAATPKSVNLWPTRIIPYTIAKDHPYKEGILDAMKKWTEDGGVFFVERNLEPNYLHIITQPGRSSSSVGMGTGSQTVVINNDYIALHELGHAIGLIHEQRRSDRDSYRVFRSMEAAPTV